MDILLNIFRLLFSLFMGILLYLCITIIILGTTFVLREAVLFFFGADLYEIMKSWVPKPRERKNKSLELLTDSDEEWLKNRGRY